MREVFFNSFKEKILNGQVPNMFDVHGTPVTSDFIDIFDNDEIKLEQYKTLDDFNKYAKGNDTKTLEQTTFKYEEYGVEYSAYYNNDVSEKPIFVNPDNWEKFLQTYSGEIGYSDPRVKGKFDQYIYQSDENINSGFYYIQKKSQLKWISERCNDKDNFNNRIVVVMGDDIGNPAEGYQLLDTVICNDPNRPFQGILDFNGHRITNIVIECKENSNGVIGYLGGDGGELGLDFGQPLVVACQRIGEHRDVVRYGEEELREVLRRGYLSQHLLRLELKAVQCRHIVAHVQRVVAGGLLEVVQRVSDFLGTVHHLLTGLAVLALGDGHTVQRVLQRIVGLVQLVVRLALHIYGLGGLYLVLGRAGEGLTQGLDRGGVLVGQLAVTLFTLLQLAQLVGLLGLQRPVDIVTDAAHSLGGGQGNAGTSDVLTENVADGNGGRSHDFVDGLHNPENGVLGDIRSGPDGGNICPAARNPDGAGDGPFRPGQLLLGVFQATLAAVTLGRQNLLPVAFHHNVAATGTYSTNDFLFHSLSPPSQLQQ